MNTIIGNEKDETLAGSAKDDFIQGNDGADRITGGDGNDIIQGDARVKSDAPRYSGQDVAVSTTAVATFISESAGYKNTLGTFVINPDGTMTDVQLLFANASLKNSGGDLIGGQSAVKFELKEGQKIGFFVAPDAFSKSSSVLSQKSGHFELRDSGGKIAKLNDAADVALYHVDDSGVATKVNTANGSTLFFLNKNQNADGLDHARVGVDVEKGIIKIGFEDLLNGGDRDYDDVVFTLNVGSKNASLWQAMEPLKVLTSQNDTISGGNGNDQIWGNGGNDRINGDNGNDILLGGSGNDTLSGGNGDDTLNGNSGDDSLYGDAGNDVMDGSSGNDRIWDGVGDDKVNGGTGRDTVFVGAGNDYYNGADGFDTIDFSGARKGVTLDLSKKTASSDLGEDVLEGFELVIGSKQNDVMRGSKDANEFQGGDGDDWFRGLGGADTFTGGKGKDTFAFSPKDVWLDKAHLGVDTIRDFNRAEDKIDVFEITKNFKGDKYSLVKLEQVGTATMLHANLGAANGGWQQVALLDGVKADELSATMKEWLIV